MTKRQRLEKDLSLTIAVGEDLVSRIEERIKELPRRSVARMFLRDDVLPPLRARIKMLRQMEACVTSDLLRPPPTVKQRVKGGRHVNG